MREISDFKSPLNYSDRRMWAPETIEHPAKAHLGMLESIILEYTKEGDNILDPMAGIGSSLIIGMLHNRNVIGIEYEEKFCKIMRSNIELSRRPRLMPLGDAEIIQGDARILSSMLKNGADGIIMSPPYSESLTKKRKGETHFDILKKTRQMTNTKDDNIANLPHGNIDSIIFSPPYEDGYRARPIPDSNERFEKLKEVEKEQANAGEKWAVSSDEVLWRKIARQDSGYGRGPNQVGNLKGQTYLQAMHKIYKGCFSILAPDGIMVLITKNFFRNKKIVPLDQHTIKLCEASGFELIKRHYRKITRQSFWRSLYKKKYGIEIPYEDILVFTKPNGGV